MKVERTRNKRADQRAVCGKRAMPRGRQMHRAHARLKRQDRKRPRIHRSVPAHRIERRAAREISMLLAHALDHDLANAFIARPEKLRPAKVAMTVRRVHPQLPHRIAELRWDPDAA